MHNGEKKAIVIEKVSNGYRIDTYDENAAEYIRGGYSPDDSHVAGSDAGAVEVMKDIVGIDPKKG